MAPKLWTWVTTSTGLILVDQLADWLFACHVYFPACLPVKGSSRTQETGGGEGVDSVPPQTFLTSKHKAVVFFFSFLQDHMVKPGNPVYFSKSHHLSFKHVVAHIY